ncbi:hypothetical protein ONE63_008423 [Megalurothrips usitatus]|uniref:Uncharacterized protein n=1 Tax=Megalurothrips usitatus TaxID=439358 RepID=A0AAV7XQA7_9NEOP|nr:hypothetical protein ONE63_008423 [Megalurothrips usitatus]
MGGHGGITWGHWGPLEVTGGLWGSQRITGASLLQHVVGVVDPQDGGPPGGGLAPRRVHPDPHVQRVPALGLQPLPGGGRRPVPGGQHGPVGLHHNLLLAEQGQLGVGASGGGGGGGAAERGGLRLQQRVGRGGRGLPAQDVVEGRQRGRVLLHLPARLGREHESRRRLRGQDLLHGDVGVGRRPHGLLGRGGAAAAEGHAQRGAVHDVVGAESVLQRQVPARQRGQRRQRRQLEVLVAPPRPPRGLGHQVADVAPAPDQEHGQQDGDERRRNGEVHGHAHVDVPRALADRARVRVGLEAARRQRRHGLLVLVGDGQEAHDVVLLAGQLEQRGVGGGQHVQRHLLVVLGPREDGHVHHEQRFELDAVHAEVVVLHREARGEVQLEVLGEVLLAQPDRRGVAGQQQQVPARHGPLLLLLLLLRGLDVVLLVLGHVVVHLVHVRVLQVRGVVLLPRALLQLALALLAVHVVVAVEHGGALVVLGRRPGADEPGPGEA